MTMKRLAIIVIVLWTAWAGAAAQNEVDRMVNHLSTIGTASFTSAVERDSKTHKIIKVVNKLVMSGPNVKKLSRTFDSEAAKQKNSYSTKKDNIITKIFTQDYPTSSRIYMIKYADESMFPETEITIIIKKR
jgi:hypothetical protein